jgi:hypothetical protein
MLLPLDGPAGGANESQEEREMKHTKKVTRPVRADVQEAWWWALGGIAGGIALDTWVFDPKNKGGTDII